MSQAAPPDPGRRLFVRRGLAAAAGVFAVSTVGLGAHTAFNGLAVNRTPVRLRGLHPALSGCRVAVVGDLHLGPFLRHDFCARVVETVNAVQPDLVAIVGDVADGAVANLSGAVAPLRDLEAPLGAYYVLGDHEYAFDAAAWLDHIERLGVRALRNERVEIRSGSGAIDLAGVNDPAARLYGEVGPDLEAALAGRDADRPTVLLAHDPIQAVDAAWEGVDLVLSGHTHGGQLVPFNLLARLRYPTIRGLAQIDETWLYVTSGAGFWGPPVRTGASPEVAVLELHADAAGT